MRRLITDGPLAEVLEQEEQAIAAMSRLLNALLDVSKLETGAIEPEMSDFKVTQLFEGNATRVRRTRRPARGCVSKWIRAVIACVPILLWSDRSCRNLVANAIKYTLRAACSSAANTSAASAKLEVVDTGHRRIPASELARHLRRFLSDRRVDQHVARRLRARPEHRVAHRQLAGVAAGSAVRGAQGPFSRSRCRQAKAPWNWLPLRRGSAAVIARRRYARWC